MINVTIDHEDWIALMIGNSRLHWAWFQGKNLRKTWDTNHLEREVSRLPVNLFPDFLRGEVSPFSPVYLASVVPAQTLFWQTYPHLQAIAVEKIPLKGIYPTLGSDRLLALWGGGNQYGFPCLVVDGGTALTLTGANQEQELIGGAILPGIRLQFRTLGTQTAALPDLNLPLELPPRWAMTTNEAIASGIIYSIIAGIKAFLEDWWQKFPQSFVIFTGGDGYLLYNHLCTLFPELQAKLIVDLTLIFGGIKALKYGEFPD
jgi:type III pantothenate kinase